MRVEKIYFNTQDGVELFGLLDTSEEKKIQMLLYQLMEWVVIVLRKEMIL